MEDLREIARGIYPAILSEGGLGAALRTLARGAAIAVDPARGSGLIGLRDRAEALGGSIEVSGPPDEGTLVLVQLPLRLS